jgi:hypothetical protein
MNWERRPEEDTPRAEQREFADDRGRTWIGTVTSGTLEGGEENAEVVFTCRDQPSEPTRVARVGVPAREADDYWRQLDESGVRSTFESSAEA